MRAQELVERYKKNDRIDIAKLIETKKYTGFAFKRKMAELVLDNCTTIVDGEVRIDSIDRYILFTMAVISMHTNLDFVYDSDEGYSGVDDYDLLCESGLLVKIIDTFKDDYASCQEVLNMMTADRMQYNTTIERKIGSFLDDVQATLGEAINGLVKKLNIDNIAEVLPSSQENILNVLNLIK